MEEALKKNQALPTALPKEHEVAGISLSMRIPPFWRDKPRLWFISFEAATDGLKKSQAQLAQMVIAQLEKQDIEQIADLLYNPPNTDQYNVLKNRLISAFEESDSRQLQKLLSEIELGDQKPSQLLRRMRTLARDKVPDSTLRLMWTSHLPPHVRSVLVVSETFSTQTKLDELALLADQMMENSNCSQVSTIQGTSPKTNDTQFLVEEIRRLSFEVAALKASQETTSYQYNTQNHHHRRSPYRRNRSTSRSRSSSRNSPYCYYHRRFGHEARKCTSPCSFKTENMKTKSEN